MPELLENRPKPRLRGVLHQAAFSVALVIGTLLAIVRRYPALVDGAFIIIAWVGIKLLAEYAHALDWIDFEVPKAVSFGLIVLIGLWYAYPLAAAAMRRDAPGEAQARPSGQRS